MPNITDSGYWWLLLASMLGMGLGTLLGLWLGSQLAKIEFTEHIKNLIRRLSK